MLTRSLLFLSLCLFLPFSSFFLYFQFDIIPRPSFGPPHSNTSFSLIAFIYSTTKHDKATHHPTPGGGFLPPAPLPRPARPPQSPVDLPLPLLQSCPRPLPVALPTPPRLQWKNSLTPSLSKPDLLLQLNIPSNCIHICIVLLFFFSPFLLQRIGPLLTYSHILPLLYNKDNNNPCHCNTYYHQSRT